MSGRNELVKLPLPNRGQVILPQEASVEQALLGLILVENDAYFRVCRDLQPEHFYEPAHQRIYEAVAKVIDRHEMASPRSLKAYFDVEETLDRIGGSKYLFDLASIAGSFLNVENYASTIVDLWQRREMIELCLGTLEDLQKPDLDRAGADLGADLGSKVGDILVAGRNRGKTRRDVLNAVVEEMQRPMRADSTGVVQLDKRMAGGLHRGRAYGLVGRKKAGKSAMAGTISYNLNEGGVPHLVVMLEMGSVGYEQRHVGRALGFNSLRFLDQKWRDDTRFLSDVAQYAHVAIDNMHYLDRPGLTFQEMQQQVVYYKHRYGIHGVILDYLQLLNGRAQRQTTAEFQDQVTQWIAEIVKRLDLWFLCLAQMNQDDNVRGGEGMRMAFDQVYAMHGGAAKKTAYLEMWESRYTPRDDVGTSLDPAFELSMAGPHFKEIEQIGKTSNQQDFEL